MNQYFFSIKSYDEILKAVGNIIKTSQEWEKDFKTLAEYLHVNMPKEKLNKASLNKLNKKLDAENKIEKSKYLLFERIIDLRNYINHEFFLVSEEKQIEEIEKELNDIQFLIFEVTDVVNNIKDNIMGKTIQRPTVFDRFI